MAIEIASATGVFLVTFRFAGYASQVAEVEAVEGGDLRPVIAGRFLGRPAEQVTVEQAEGPFESVAAALRHRAEQPYTDERLRADLVGDAPGPGRAAAHLLTLDTPARRLRAVQAAHTAMNLVGGRYSARVYEAVQILRGMIEGGREGDEMSVEMQARQLREADEARRAVQRLVIAAQHGL